MHSVALFAVLAGILLVADVANGGKFRRADTRDGFCHTRFGRIPVGTTHYTPNLCMRVNCQPGGYSITGCGFWPNDDPNCILVSKNGRHPICCPTIKCTNK